MQEDAKFNAKLEQQQTMWRIKFHQAIYEKQLVLAFLILIGRR